MVMAPARLVRAAVAVLSLAPIHLAHEDGEGVPSSGEFQGIPACVEPGDEAAELRNCLFGMERILSTPTHRVPCYEYHRGTRSDDYHPATQAEENEEGSHMGWYFNTTTRKCVPVAPGECVACIPFVAESGCTDACGALESAEELELEREAEFEEEMLQTWEVVYHFSIAVYVCFALALLCDDFFVASLDIIILKMDLPPDVAGATLMAAGTSSPELFTASVGVFITHDPVGVGAVVGSTMFNTLCIVGGSAIACGHVVPLDGRIFYRDGLSYAFAIVILYFVLFDGELTPLESWLLLAGYTGYVVLCTVYGAMTSRWW